MRPSLIIAALLASPSVALAADPVAPAASADASSSGDTAVTLRKRFNPGLSLGVVSDVRSFEGLDGSAASVGASLGWAFDLVTLNAQVLQSLAVVGERKPLYLKANGDFAFATFGGFSVLGTVGLDYVIKGPDRQTTEAPGNLLGPEIGLGARYRFLPQLDLVAYGTIAAWAAATGPRRMYVEPGIVAGIQIHPFGSED